MLCPGDSILYHSDTEKLHFTVRIYVSRETHSSQNFVSFQSSSEHSAGLIGLRRYEGQRDIRMEAESVITTLEKEKVIAD